MKDRTPPPGMTVVSEKAYVFVPPRDSDFWPWFGSLILPWYLKRTHAIESWDFVGLEKLRASLDAGHGILIVPNHPRLSDPISLGLLVKALHQNVNIMASAHLFLQSGVMTWLLPRFGAFSVYREGMDRESLLSLIHI